jgi:hypothetical protein
MSKPSQADLLAEIERCGLAVVRAQHLHDIFPGPEPTDVEIEFQRALFQEGGGMYNARGSSHLNQSMNFMHKHRVNSRMVKDKMIYWRGRVIIDNIAEAVEAGKPVWCLGDDRPGPTKP